MRLTWPSCQGTGIQKIPIYLNAAYFFRERAAELVSTSEQRKLNTESNGYSVIACSYIPVLNPVLASERMHSPMKSADEMPVPKRESANVYSKDSKADTIYSRKAIDKK